MFFAVGRFLLFCVVCFNFLLIVFCGGFGGMGFLGGFFVALLLLLLLECKFKEKIMMRVHPLPKFCDIYKPS